MRYGKVVSVALHGIDGIMVEIEIALLQGLPGFEIVGLGDSAIRESKNRIQAAIRNSGFNFPSSKITASLAPAWLRKTGSGYDLPLAVAILIASGQVRLHRAYQGRWPALFGELSLDGQVRPIPGVFNRVARCADDGVRHVLLPLANWAEGRAVGAENLSLLPIDSLKACVDCLHKDPAALDVPESLTDHEREVSEGLPHPALVESIVGQDRAIRALAIAAAGWHPVLLLGSPGSGKTAMAACLPWILPALDPAEAKLITRIHSAAGLLQSTNGLVQKRPYCAPHFSLTRASLLGGGSPPQPGLCSLSHRGVLFLDELTLIDSRTLDALRQPLEAQQVTLSRLKSQLSYPADFLLVAAANPCPCGLYFEPGTRCHCAPETVARHLGKISGPLLDRIDLAVEVLRPGEKAMKQSVRARDLRSDSGWQTSTLQQRIADCWARQKERCAAHDLLPVQNSRLQHPDLAKILEISEPVLAVAQRAAEHHLLSVRGFQKVLRVARTIADFEASYAVQADHVLEALQYRLREPVRGQA